MNSCASPFPLSCLYTRIPAFEIISSCVIFGLRKPGVFQAVTFGLPETDVAFRRGMLRPKLRLVGTVPRPALLLLTAVG